MRQQTCGEARHWRGCVPWGLCRLLHACAEARHWRGCVSWGVSIRHACASVVLLCRHSNVSCLGLCDECFVAVTGRVVARESSIADDETANGIECSSTDLADIELCQMARRASRQSSTRLESKPSDCLALQGPARREERTRLHRRDSEHLGSATSSECGDETGSQTWTCVVLERRCRASQTPTTCMQLTPSICQTARRGRVCSRLCATGDVRRGEDGRPRKAGRRQRREARAALSQPRWRSNERRDTSGRERAHRRDLNIKAANSTTEATEHATEEFCEGILQILAPLGCVFSFFLSFAQREENRAIMGLTRRAATRCSRLRFPSSDESRPRRLVSSRASCSSVSWVSRWWSRVWGRLSSPPQGGFVSLGVASAAPRFDGPKR